jgi:Glycosyltransferase family 87
MVKNTSIFVLLLAVAGVSWLRYSGVPSPDLLATWMAGKYFAAGQFDQIYHASDGLFTMRPPPAWVPDLRAQGYEGAIFPFIYPPIWAWLAAQFEGVTSAQTFFSLASFINPLLLGATIWLAARMVADKLAPLVFVLTMIAIFATSLSALVALEQNQPQILVGFLMVLGVERTQARAPVLGGLAMAVAAALKLYPAIFALIWLAKGERRAAAAFALFGGAIGLASVALAGWPLHAAFLSEIGAISGTVLVTFLTFSLDPTIAQAFFADQFQSVASLRIPSPGEAASAWSVMAKPLLWRLGDGALMLAVVVFLLRAARGPRGRDALFWPFAFTLLALVSPLSWGYHYLPALAFAPALTERFGLRPGTLALAAVFLPASTFYLLANPAWLPWQVGVQPLSTAAMALYALLLWRALRKPPVAPLHPPTPGL